MAKSGIDLRRFAALGAYARIEQLQAEIDEIRAAFPRLRRVPTGGPSSGGTTAQTGEGKPRKRRKMSAAARKRIGDAQRKRWAKQKAATK